MPAARPLVSIIIPVLNGAPTLRRCLDSIRRLALQCVELIVIDGGSTDGTVDILHEYDDLITRLDSGSDKGIYDAMNKGISQATGDWLYFLGADDVLLEGFVRIMGSLRDHNTIYYGNVLMPWRKRRYDGRFSTYKLACRNICHQSIFYPRLVWNRHAFKPEYPVLADYELNIRCFRDPDFRFVYLPETVARFQDSKGTSQMRMDARFERDKLRLVREKFPGWIYYLIAVRTAVIGFLKCAGLYGYTWKIKNFLARTIRQ